MVFFYDYITFKESSTAGIFLSLTQLSLPCPVPFLLSDGGGHAYAWDAQGWIGTDYDKLFLTSDGEQPLVGQLEEAEVQLLYSRLISDFFDAQVGVRYDFEPDPERAYAVLGLQGLAPQFFEIDTALFVSEKGDVSARVEAEYELLITQRLRSEEHTSELQSLMRNSNA